VIGDSGIAINCLGIYEIPLKIRRSMRKQSAVGSRDRHAHLFGANVVAGFTGRLRGKNVEESMPRFKSFTPSPNCGDRGVRLAFENCDMGATGTQRLNIAFSSTAWEMMFTEVPRTTSAGMEPCHQLAAGGSVASTQEVVNKVFTSTARMPPSCGMSSRPAAFVRKPSLTIVLPLRRHELDGRDQHFADGRLQGPSTSKLAYPVYRMISNDGKSTGSATLAVSRWFPRSQSRTS